MQTEWTSGDTLSFYGSVLSTVLAVLGVILTIQHEQDTRRKDNSVLYKPILELVHVNPHSLPEVCSYRKVGLGYGIGYCKNDITEDQINNLLSQQHVNNPKYILLFQNVGRGETFNTVVDDFKVTSVNWKDISNIAPNIGCNQYIGEIVQNGYFYISVNLPDYLIIPKNLENQRWFELGADLEISYSDMFDRIRYQTTLNIKHKITVLEETTPSPLIYDDNYHYVKVIYEPYEIMPLKKIFSIQSGTFVEQHELSNKNDERLNNYD